MSRLRGGSSVPPLFIWGQPGCGKSALIEQAAAEIGGDFIGLRLGQRDPVDLAGIPVPDVANRVATWLRPDFIPSSGKGILFLDEFAQAPHAVQAAASNILDRQRGSHQLADGWAICLASNRETDAAGANRVLSHLANRVTHVTLEPDLDDFLEWGIDRIIPEIRAYLRYRPSHLTTFDPSKVVREKAYATPRSWHGLSREIVALGGIGSEFRYDAARGNVGDGVALEFEGFCRVYETLPDLHRIFRDPKKSPVPQEPSALWATVCGLADHFRRDQRREHGAACMLYAGRLPVEFGVVLARDICRIMPALVIAPEAKPFLTALRELEAS